MSAAIKKVDLVTQVSDTCVKIKLHKPKRSKKKEEPTEAILEKGKTEKTIAPEECSKFYFPNNPRAQELDTKVRKGMKLTDEERTELRQYITLDEERLWSLAADKMFSIDSD